MMISRQIYFIVITFLMGSGLFAQSSPLASGSWHKIEVKESGLVRLDYDFLSQIGVTNPKNIQVYGYGGIVPQLNSETRYGDLVENTVYVEGQSDGVLNTSDFLVFFAQGPHPLSISEGNIVSSFNPYSESSYYFIRQGTSEGKRVSNVSLSSGNSSVLTSLPYIIHHEQDLNNVVGSGREWQGESFRFQDTRSWDFNLTDLKNSESVTINATYTGGSDDFRVIFNTSINGSEEATSSLSSVGGDYGFKARSTTHTINKTLSNDGLTISTYFNNNGDFAANGYLGDIKIEYERELNLDRSSYYKIPSSSNNNKLNLVNSSGTGRMVWDVSDITDVRSLSISNSSVEIDASVSDLLLVNTSSTISYDYLGAVGNQNLHGGNVPELLLITQRDFAETASRYEVFKESVQGVSTKVSYVDEIYNEFSSGAQDVSAIRDYIKHLYDQGGLKYVLLLGDCSYDYKNILSNNTNYVPIYQSRESFHNVNSYSSDDFYGLLGDDEGYWEECGTCNDETLDIGVGRIPISSNEEGDQYLEKLKAYLSNSESMGNWRNEVVFVADDGDSNTHISHAYEISSDLEVKEPGLNVSRMFLSAYNQESTSSGQKSPEFNEAFNRKMDQGALVVNYSGHGSEEQWAQEEILTFDQIESFSNISKLPFFITATCEFGRYDNPLLRSGAERLILNPDGGAIGLMTTTRPVYSSSNKVINESFYEQVFERDENYKFRNLGDVLIHTKNNSLAGVNNRNFSLLGDPSMKLAYPDFKVGITQLNDSEEIENDTVRALQKVQVAGVIQYPTGEFDSTFNGTIKIKFFDKKAELTTLGEDPFDYLELNSVIFEGGVEVVDGKYSAEFIVPKDISYSFGEGKFSFYAEADDGRDASGYFSDVIVGGGISGFVDDDSPMVDLYVNDETFISGGTVGRNPVFIAHVNDENGINTTNTGIGHEMTLVIDGDRENIEVLNDFYSSLENTYQEGEVVYPLYDLSLGEHILTFKAWDVNNNSIEESIEIVVTEKAEIHPYPNPFSDLVTIYIDQPRRDAGGTVDFQVLDRYGRVVYEQFDEFDEFTSIIEEVVWDGNKENGEELDNGVYFIQALLRYENGVGDILEKSKVVLHK